MDDIMNQIIWTQVYNTEKNVNFLKNILIQLKLRSYFFLRFKPKALTLRRLLTLCMHVIES